MLFRRCAAYTFAFLAITTFIQAKDVLDEYQKRGKDLGRSLKPIELSDKDLESLMPKDLRGQEFDGEIARKQLNTTPYQPMESHLKKIDPAIQATIENGENALKELQEPLMQEEKIVETTEKCLVETTFVPMTLNHTLEVNIKHQPQVMQKTKICRGHYTKEKSDQPKKDKSNKKKQLSNDPTVKSFDVRVEKTGMLHRDLVIAHWWHIDNASNCNLFLEEDKQMTPEKWEEIDIWTMDRPEILNSLDCTLLSTIDGSQETRIIEGRSVTRPFWTKKHELQCRLQRNKQCQFLTNKNCRLVGENCLEKEGEQCKVLEKIFKCRQYQKQPLFNVKDIYGTDPQLWDTIFEPSQTFPDVYTKLSVFDEIKRELQMSQAGDIRSVQLFKGMEQQCSKSIAKDVMYDCCIDMDGLATKMKLSKCTSDEIALADYSRKGLTHYVGVKKEKFLGLWVSRKEHVFCVFPTKLSRVFQEESRKQLNIEWGTADSPDCRGLTQEELKRLDFSKLDLMEAFEIPKEINSEEKIRNIEEHLKLRLQNT